VSALFSVNDSEDFRRIASIPRRDPSELFDPELCAAASRALRTVNGSRVFRPIQSAGLITCARSVELGSPGAFLPIGVGKGKTDLSFCLPFVLAAERSVLTVPGGLTTSRPGVLGKTERDFRTLREHWKETPFGQIISYERLGRVRGGDLLESYAPTLIVSDEAHALRNIANAKSGGAACANVVIDYVKRSRKAGREVIWIVLSGTMTGGSLQDYAHLAEYTLGPVRSFLPLDDLELDLWRRAVDAEVEVGARVEPGVLLKMPHEATGSKLKRARNVIQRRMFETEGVIASTDSGVAASLRFSFAGDAGGGVDQDTWFKLRDDWRLPNGEQCLDGFEAHRHAREFACGFFGEWDPPPPIEWRKRRARWAKEAHEAIKDRLCNTEVEARELLDSEAWHEWAEVRNTFTPNPVARWLSDATLEACVAWAKRRKSGIIWTQHIPFGERLERDFGIPYFRDHGLNSEGVYIEQASGIICASVQANFQGRNLQHRFADNLIVSPFGSAERNEQLHGRTHREEQPSDVVCVDFLVVCREHVSALRRAREKAAAIELEPMLKREGNQCKSKIDDETDEDDDRLFAAITEGLDE
jgi:hypothetical protein